MVFTVGDTVLEAAITGILGHSKTTKILAATSFKDLNSLNELVEELGGPAEIVRVRDKKGHSALHIAAALGKLVVCEYLIDKLLLEVDIIDDKGETPLFHATLGGHLLTVEMLINRGASLNTKSHSDLTPLHYAASKGNKALVLRFCWSDTVDVNSMSHFGTPLNMAAHGKPEVVRILLANNADPNLDNKSAFSPLLSAVLANSLDSVKILIEAGANPNHCTWDLSPLLLAATHGDPAIIHALIKAGADTNFTNKCGLKPICTAALKGRCGNVIALYPHTSVVKAYPEWSMMGIVKYVHSSEAREKIDRQSAVIAKRFIKAGDKAKVRKDYYSTIYWYSKAIEWNDNPDMMHELLCKRSICSSATKEGTKGLLDAMTSINLNSKKPLGHYCAGVALMCLKDFDKAQAAFLRSLELEPSSTEFLHGSKCAHVAQLRYVGVNVQTVE